MYPSSDFWLRHRCDPLSGRSLAECPTATSHPSCGPFPFHTCSNSYEVIRSTILFMKNGRVGENFSKAWAAIPLWCEAKGMERVTRREMWFGREPEAYVNSSIFIIRGFTEGGGRSPCVFTIHGTCSWRSQCRLLLAMVLTRNVQIHSALFNLFLRDVLEKGSCSPRARRIEKAVSTV